MKSKGVKVTDQNLLTAYNSAQTLLKHKYPVAEAFNKDFEEADRYGILGLNENANFPETTKAMMFKDSETGERYTFNGIPLPKNLKSESWDWAGDKFETIGDLVDKDPAKVINLKQQITNPVRVLPFLVQQVE